MKRFRVWFVLALIFLAGFTAGALTTRVITRHIIRAVLAHPERLEGHVERTLKWKLQLNAQQQAEVHRILVETEEQLKALRERAQPQLHAILAKAHRDIVAVLTPEQQRRFESFMAQHAFPVHSTEGVIPK